MLCTSKYETLFFFKNTKSYLENKRCRVPQFMVRNGSPCILHTVYVCVFVMQRQHRSPDRTWKSWRNSAVLGIRNAVSPTLNRGKNHRLIRITIPVTTTTTHDAPSHRFLLAPGGLYAHADNTAPPNAHNNLLFVLYSLDGYFGFLTVNLDNIAKALK